MVTLPDELWLSVFRFLDPISMESFALLSYRFLELYQKSKHQYVITCRDDLDMFLTSMQNCQRIDSLVISGDNYECPILTAHPQDIINLMSSIDTIDPLRVRDILRVADTMTDYKLNVLLKDINIVNLVLDNYHWDIIEKIPHKHLVVREHICLASIYVPALLMLPGTLELNCYLSRRDIEKLVHKFRNTYTICDDVDGFISSKNKINKFISVPFNIWRGDVNVTQPMMKLIKEHLGADPIELIHIASLNPIMCWQHYTYNISLMTQHIYVHGEFLHIYSNIKSILVGSLKTLLDFKSDISKANMSRISVIYVGRFHDDQIRELAQMYPSIHTVYSLFDEGHNIIAKYCY